MRARSNGALVCVSWVEGMKDRSGVGTGGRGIDPLLDQSAPKDQYAPAKMQGLPRREPETVERKRDR